MGEKQCLYHLNAESQTGLLFYSLSQHAKERVYGCRKLQQNQAKKKKTGNSKKETDVEEDSDDEGNFLSIRNLFSLFL